MVAEAKRQKKKAKRALKAYIEKNAQAKDQTDAEKKNKHEQARVSQQKARSFANPLRQHPRVTVHRADAPDVEIRLPAPTNYRRSNFLNSSTKPAPVSPLAHTLMKSIDIELNSKRIPVWLPQSKPFPFLDLPGELRNKVYGYFFDAQHYKIQFMSRKVKALTYVLPNLPRCYDPKVPLTAARRRRQHDYPRRVRSNEGDIPPFELMPGPCALLNAHPRIGQEAAPFFYAIQTFSFSSCRVLNKFMNMLSQSSKEAITDVRLHHFTAGYPRFNFIEYRHKPSNEIRQYLTEPYKLLNDHLWEDTLWRLGTEMCNLEKLALHEIINEIPMEVHEKAYWREPLSEALSGMPKLREVNIKFKSFHADATVLEVEAYKLQQELLAEPYRDTEEAIENVSNSEHPEKLLPPAHRGPVKILRLVMPGYERPAY